MLMTAFLPPLQKDLPGPGRRIIAAVSEIDRVTLHRVSGKMAAVSQREEKTWERKLQEFFFPSLGCMLQCLPPFKCTDFMKRVREL
jgi:hypothetical protein